MSKWFKKCNIQQIEIFLHVIDDQKLYVYENPYKNTPNGILYGGKIVQEYIFWLKISEKLLIQSRGGESINAVVLPRYYRGNIAVKPMHQLAFTMVKTG